MVAAGHVGSSARNRIVRDRKSERGALVLCFISSATMILTRAAGFSPRDVTVLRDRWLRSHVRAG
jgi:hypothetical protein